MLHNPDGTTGSNALSCACFYRLRPSSHGKAVLRTAALSLRFP